MTPEKRNSDTTKLNHSGNLPGDLNEKPLIEFDTPLGQAPINQLPENLSTSNLHETFTPTPTPEKKRGFFSKTRNKVIAGIAGVAVLGGVGAGIAAADHKGPDHQTSASGPKTPSKSELPSSTATPETTQTSTPETTSTPEVAPMSPEVASLDAMDLTTFESQPEAQQLTWLSYELPESYLRQFESDYVTAKGPSDPNDILPAGEPSADDTAQEALTYAGVMERAAFSLPGLAAQKAVFTVFNTPSQANRINQMESSLAQIQATGGSTDGMAAWMQGADKLLPVPDVTKETDRGTLPDGTSYVSDMATDPLAGNAPLEGTIYLKTFTDATTGQQRSWWF